MSLDLKEIAELRALGVKSAEVHFNGAYFVEFFEPSLALAPAGSPSAVVPPNLDEPLTESALPAPGAADDVEPEFRGDPNQCAHVGCGEPRGGVLGGKQAKFCRKHAFERLGVKS